MGYVWKTLEKIAALIPGRPSLLTKNQFWTTQVSNAHWTVNGEMDNAS